MKQKHVDYQVVPDPKLRRLEAAAFRPAHHTPMIHGLLEVDVSRARAFLREHKAVQAFRKGRKHLILFEEVDVYTLIDRDVAGQEQPITYIVRAANRKTFLEIHQEIRAAQVQDLEKDLKWFQFLPDFFFRPFFWVFYWLGRRYPQMWKKFVGTVGLTAVGMFGKGAAWGIPQALPTLMMTAGGIGEKPVLVDGHLALREYLSLTISCDHDIIDGAPAARFTERLKELIESGYGLYENEVEHGVSLPG